MKLAIRSALLLFFPSHLNLTYIRSLLGYVLPPYLKIYSFSEFHSQGSQKWISLQHYTSHTPSTKLK